MNKLDNIEKAQLKSNIPDFIPGDTVRVHVRIKESETKERLQAFEGIVIARRGKGVGETITVRKTSFGVGVERIFPLHATIIDHIDVVKHGRVRRAKLYFLRALRGKAARIRERDTRQQASRGKDSLNSTRNEEHLRIDYILSFVLFASRSRLFSGSHFIRALDAV